MEKKQELKARLAAVETERDMARREAEYLRKRESARNRAEFAEKQAKLKQAERAERRERLQRIVDGHIPFDGPSVVSRKVVHEQGRKPRIEVVVELSTDELRAVRTHQDREARTAAMESIQDRVNDMHKKVAQIGYQIF